MGPLIKILFAEEPSSAYVALTDIVPSQMHSLLGELGGQTILRQDLYVLLPALLVGAALVKGMFSFLNQYYLQRISLWVAMNLRNHIFGAILGQKWVTLSQKSPAQWMSLVMNDVHFLQVRLSDLAAAMIRDVVVVIFCLGAMFLIHPTTALILCLCMGPLAWSLGLVGRRISYYANRWQILIARFADFSLGVRKRFDFIRSQQGEDRELKRFQLLNDGYYKLAKQSILVRSAFAPVLEWIGFAAFALILWAVGRGMWGEELHGDRLIQFLAGIGLVLRPLKNIGEQYSRLGEVTGALRRSTQLLQDQRPATSHDRDMPRGDSEVALSWPIQLWEGRVAYGEESIIQWSDLSVSAGKLIAIVGPSGGGKSTLVRCLSGLLEASDWSGSICQHQLKKQISFVSQKPFLFKDTIRANLLYGKDLGDYRDDDLWGVLKHVELDDLVKELPDHLETAMGATQTVLSGGQIQRLTLARSLLDKKPIMVCDEVTSALDPEIELKLIAHLRAVVQDSPSSLIFVTHRLQVLEKFDEVWFVEQGRIQFRGTLDAVKRWPRFQDFIGGETLA